MLRSDCVWHWKWWWLFFISWRLCFLKMLSLVSIGRLFLAILFAEYRWFVGGLCKADWRCILLAVLCVSVLLSASLSLFALLRYLGACYLVYFGFASFREIWQKKCDKDETISIPQNKRIFFRALLPMFWIPKRRCFLWGDFAAIRES